MEFHSKYQVALVWVMLLPALCLSQFKDSRATFYYTPDGYGTSSGACGYGDYGRSVNHGRVADVAGLWRDGAGCGACYQVRCKISRLCHNSGMMVVATDYGAGDNTDFIMSPNAFSKLGRNPRASAELEKYGVVDVEYMRVPCTYGGSNVRIKIHDSSNYPYYLAIIILYVPGMNDVIAVGIYDKDAREWKAMRRVYGAVFDIVAAPSGPLTLRLQFSDTTVLYIFHSFPMADVDTTFLSELTPGFSVKPLMISVDRVALRETTITEGDPPFSFRELQSVDLYCWDEEGSRVVYSLVTPTAIDVYGQIILPRRKYYVSRYLVAEPGYGIHQSFHLRFDELTGVELSEDPFVDRVYNLRIPAEIPTCLTYLGTLYDVCGYVKNASQVGVRRLEGYAEKQFMISLESRIKTDVTDVRTMVTIYLRGAWTEAVCAKIRKLLMSSDAMPFILLKHLKLGRPAFTGRAVLRSVGDATRVYFNPEIQEVVEKRAEMFSG